MAKDKKKAGKLPKSIKIPKELRRGAEQLLTQAQTPAGRAAIAKGAKVIAGVATMAAQVAAAKKAKAQPLSPGQTSAQGAGQPGTVQPDAVADAINAGVDLVLGKLFPKR